MKKNLFLMILALLFVLVVFLSGCIENGEAPLPVDDVSFDASFCEVDSDCVFTDSCQTCVFSDDGCSDEVGEGICFYCCPQSINSEARELLLEWEEENCESHISCQYEEPFSTESFCNNGVCELKEYVGEDEANNEENIVIDKEKNMCEVDSDCVSVENTCLTLEYIANLEKEAAEQGIYIRRPEFTDGICYCENNYCVEQIE